MWEFVAEHALEILGVVLGVIYLIFELKAWWPLWIVSVIMPIPSLFVKYKAGLYADFAIDIYYVIVAIYGLIVWLRGMKKKDVGAGGSFESVAKGESKTSSDSALQKGEENTESVKGGKEELPITRTPLKWTPLLIGIFVVLLVVIAFILKDWTNSTVPWADSFTTALSIIAMWMLARKWIEQWWVWFVVDAVSCALYVYKGLYFYSGLYFLYTVLAIYGYFNWLKMMMRQSQ